MTTQGEGADTGAVAGGRFADSLQPHVKFLKDFNLGLLSPDQRATLLTKGEIPTGLVMPEVAQADSSARQISGVLGIIS